MFNLSFNDDEINLIWAVLNNSNIPGKHAVVLSGIFNKIQNAVRLYSMQQEAQQANQEFPEDSVKSPSFSFEEEKHDK